MDVLQEIFRSNGRSIGLWKHERTHVGKERGLFYVRGTNKDPREVVTVFLTAQEVDRLIRARNEAIAAALPAPTVASALAKFLRLGRVRQRR